MIFEYNEEKDDQLSTERDIGFRDIIYALESDDYEVLDDLEIINTKALMVHLTESDFNSLVAKAKAAHMTLSAYINSVIHKDAFGITD